MADGYCRRHPDPFGLWFSTHRRDLERAKSPCNRCDVERECFAYAMADPKLVGVFGATDERDRARIWRRKYRRRAA